MIKKKLPSVGQVLQFIESKAPTGAAEAWDNVGLLAGDAHWPVRGVKVAIDLTRSVLQEAKRKKCGLILTHHPCIFPKNPGWNRLVAEGPESLSSLMIEALQNHIAIASVHTNFDVCALEVVEVVSKSLGLLPRGRLLEKSQSGLCKLSVFVPASHVGKVREAICEAGAGHIGLYDLCTFASPGRGTFRGSAEASPFFGKPGRLEEVEELRLETVFPKGLQKPIVQALHQAHPYEEVAYDIYPLEQGPSGRLMTTGLVRGLGYGFWGDFSQSKSFSELSRGVRRVFKIEAFKVTGPVPSRIRRVAFVAGKGASFISAAIAARCDVLITGETGYHPALDGARHDLAVMELGHPESERFFLTTVSQWLRESGLKIRTHS